VVTAGLTDRWRTPEGEALAEEVIVRLVGGRGLEGLRLDWHEGRIDLRGLPVPIPARLRRFQSQGWFVEALGDLITFRGARLRGLDLSGAQAQSLRFFGSQIADCRLDGANCQDWRLWDTVVSDCSFSKASLRDAAVGTWHENRRNRWKRVDFGRSDFRVGTCWAAVFEDCDFSGAKFTGVKFSQCTLANCRFVGVVKDVLFDGRDLSPERPAPPQMGKVDFSAAVFGGVEFRGYDLEDVKLPDDTDVLLLRRARCVARKAIHALGDREDTPSLMLRAVLENRLRGPGDEREAEVFNRRDYRGMGGEELVALAGEVLGRAEVECTRDSLALPQKTPAAAPRRLAAAGRGAGPGRM
jgi:Pentapeptide repeats (9 copies)